MYRSIPNMLTMLRLALAAVFFVILNQFRYDPDDLSVQWTLWLATGVFIVAMLTDIADGYLARKWQVESAFGRIMDPFVDKVIVLGALIYLAGPRFVDPRAVAEERFFNMISGVYPWMVAVMLARELLVTGIRGEMESRGIRFGAKLWGKLKTLLQSVTIPFVIGIVAVNPYREGYEWWTWVRDGLVYAMVLTTLISGVPYITGAMKASKTTVNKEHGI